MKQLRVFPAPELREKSTPVANPNSWTELVEHMKKTVEKAEGVGLAAPQVGVNKRIFLMQKPEGNGWDLFFNPEIIERSELNQVEESCLSFPGISITVERGRVVRFRALDENAEPVERVVEDLLAQCVQHEIDHLDGITLYDYAVLTEKLEMQQSLQNSKEC